MSTKTISAMLKKTLNAYHNRAIATQEVIEAELINLKVPTDSKPADAPQVTSYKIR